MTKWKQINIIDGHKQRMTLKKLKGTALPPLDSAYNKVMWWFFAFPNAEESLSDLVRKLRVSKTTINRVVNMLTKQQLLKKRTFGKIWRIDSYLIFLRSQNR